MERERRLAGRVRNAWMACAPMRARRQRMKSFTYGAQWEDECRSPDGRLLSERRLMEEQGRVPITNNILRQMVKTIVGRYRYLRAQGEMKQQADQNLLGRMITGASGEQQENDARTLEEFLISGMAIQRVEQGVGVPVSPGRFLHERFMRADGSDCRLLGMLHDLPPAEVLRIFGAGDPAKAEVLKQAFRASPQGEQLMVAQGVELGRAAIPGTWRVIEVWERVGSEWLEVYDPFLKLKRRAEPDELARLQGINRARSQVGSEPLEWKHRSAEHWRQSWLTASGVLLGSNEGGEPPFVMRFYPMIDGEVHSLVEDVVDQQKYVNRLISLLDHIISSSAKGVLLYPADQLPDGFTWRDLRRIWSTPNGIMPYKRTAKGVSPEQVHTGSEVGAGAAEMLRTQLQLFEQISGSSGALQGSSRSAAGEGMLLAEMESATIALMDLLSAFATFTMQRDSLINNLKENEKDHTTYRP